MLSGFDEFPIHQTPEPIAHPGSGDRNVYDRYWFNGFTPDGALFFGVALGLYPNRSIMDAAFSVVHDGEQRSFHASRRAPSHRDELRVGPLRIEVVEPMRTLRVVLEPNETGLACDLTFRPRTACIEEGRQVLRREGRIWMDVTRFAQFGRWQGSIDSAGRTLVVDPVRTLATRDRSWGIRPVGGPEAIGAPPTAPPQVYFLWAPIHWTDTCTHLCVFEDAAGRAQHAEGCVVPAYGSPDQLPGIEDPGVQHMAGVTHRLDYRPGTRRARSGALSMRTAAGERLAMTFEPLLTFQMKGLGYRHPQWPHGAWKGELATGGDGWRTDALDPLALENVHVQQVVRARMGEQEGFGVVEQLCIGPHAPSGFSGLVDGAR